MESERVWERLGEAFARKRHAAGLTQVEAAERLTLTRSPIQAIERGRQANGKPFTKVTTTMRAYARLLGWTEDSPDRILRGDEPEDDAHTKPADASDLPPAVDRELRSGRTLDHTVVHIGDEDADTRIIVVLKGAEDISEQDLDRLWRQWRKTRRQIQSLPGDSDAAQDS